MLTIASCTLSLVRSSSIRITDQQMMSLLLALGPRFVEAIPTISSRGRIRSQPLSFLRDGKWRHDFIAHGTLMGKGVLECFITHTLFCSTNRACDGACGSPHRSDHDWSVPGFQAPPCQGRSQARQLDQACAGVGSLNSQHLVDTSRSIIPLSPTPIYSRCLWVLRDC